MSQSGPGRREVAYRLFAAEFDDSELSYSESDEERAPNYVVTPTGARVNRLFAVGVLTEVEDVNPEMVRGRVVDPTGAFVTYAGQYQPDALAFLERADPPSFLALSGKARTFEPEDSDRIYTSVRPEAVSEVDAETRDRWIVTAAERTLERIGIVASAIESGLTGEQLEAALSEAGVDERLAEGVALALDHYGTTPAYLDALRELSIGAVRVVAGERDEVGRLELEPGEGNGDASVLSTLDLSRADGAASTEERGIQTADPTDGDAAAGPDSDAEVGEATATVETDEGGDEPAESEAVVDDSPTLDSETDAEAMAEPEGDIEPETATSDASEPATEAAPTGGDEAASESEPVASQETASEEDIAAVEEELDDFDPGEFELDEEERREVEEEFGTEFSTAGEVESAETESKAAAEPEPETEQATPETAPDAESETESEPEPETSEPESESEPEPTDEPADESIDDVGEVDLADAVMDTMERLDEGDGADRETLVTTVADEHGADADAVEEAIQEALMSGRCYEPTDGTLKSI